MQRLLALADPESQGTAAARMGIAPEELDLLRSTVINTEGKVIFMFGGELSESAMALVANSLITSPVKDEACCCIPYRFITTVSDCMTWAL